jgi:hypothetical protein
VYAARIGISIFDSAIPTTGVNWLWYLKNRKTLSQYRPPHHFIKKPKANAQLRQHLIRINASKGQVMS